MTPESHERFRSLFERALALPSADRSAFLERECADDAELRSRVAALIRSHEDAGPFLQTSTPTEGATRPLRDLPADAQQIGPYSILEKLGEGGFGVVYLAEQQRPIRRKVALKLLRAGPTSAQVLARFEAERQALALMDHPNIATVHDAGATERGDPYFVMEYVAGLPITAYADASSLSIPDRLRLFLQVCEAIQHAHTKGVIHRDLKPSNVLVTRAGDKALVKVIDFGVAKALGARLTDETLYTQQGVMIGTPEYMSPEQALGSPLGVDTRSDVYSLGVILYELLVGVLPFDRKDSAESGVLGLLQTIREKDPPKLSTRLRMTGTAASAASKRRTDPPTLARQLRGDLEWITGKSLEKDPSRRYASAAAFAEDVSNYLEDRPIVARPRSTVYQLRKFAARHRVAASFGVVLALSIVAFATAMSVMYGKQRVERKKAQEMNDFLVNMLASVDPAQARGKDVLVRDILDQASAKVSTELADEPEVEAMLERTISDVYMALGLYDEALVQSRACVEANRRAYGPRHLETAKALAALGDLEFSAGQTDSAVVTLRRALAAGESSRKRDPELLAFTYNSLANILGRRRQCDEADSLFERALDAASRMGEPDSAAYGAILNDRSLMLRDCGKVTEAAASAEHALALRERTLGPDHPSTITALGNLASIRAIEGRYSEAEQMLRRVTEAQEKLLGPNHPNLAANLSSRGRALSGLGRYAEADSILTRSLEIYRAAYGEKSAQAAQLHHNLGQNADRAERFPEAEAHFRQALATWQEVWGPDHPSTWNTMNSLARVLACEGKFAEARSLARRVVDARTAKLGAAHPEVRRAKLTLGEIAMREGRQSEAESLFRDGLEALSREERPSEVERAWIEGLLGECLWKQGDAVAAEPLLVKSTPIVATAAAISPAARRSAAAATVAVLESLGKSAEAERFRALGDSLPAHR